MKSLAQPLISVVMPVYNARSFLDDSIGSILGQTLSDFEFVILDDASTDDSVKLLREWAVRDERIRIHQSNERLGLSGSSNAVIAHAHAAVIARMDADDIAHPDRLRRQWDVLQNNTDIAAVGTLYNGIDANGREVRPRDRWRLVRRSGYIPFPHGSTMFRREVFDKLGGYDESAIGAEDQELFSRMALHGRVVTLPDVLYSYRYHSNNATLLNGMRAVTENNSHNGDSVAALYMLGAMRLWSGAPPMLLEPMLKNECLKWDLKSLMIFVSAVWGHVSPSTLRIFLSTSIRARDSLASLRVKDGRTYEWLLEK